MAKYRFRLQKVMEARQCQEDRKRQDLAAAQRILEREKRRLLHLHSEGQRCRREMLEGALGHLDVQREAMYRARFTRLMRDIDRQVEAVEHSAERVCREREALLQCSKERRMLENLRDKGLLECVRAWLRREQKEVDDIGRDMFLRRPDDAVG
jgi:flagellar FliJ protein